MVFPSTLLLNLSRKYAYQDGPQHTSARVANSSIGNCSQPSPADRASAAPQTTAFIADLDPTFDVQAFRFLADHYHLSRDNDLTFSDLCQNNAEVRLPITKIVRNS